MKSISTNIYYLIKRVSNFVTKSFVVPYSVYFYNIQCSVHYIDVLRLFWYSNSDHNRWSGLCFPFDCNRGILSDSCTPCIENIFITEVYIYIDYLIYIYMYMHIHMSFAYQKCREILMRHQICTRNYGIIATAAHRIFFFSKSY